MKKNFVAISLVMALSACNKAPSSLTQILPSSQEKSPPSQPQQVSGQSLPGTTPLAPAEQVQAQVDQAATSFNQLPQYALTSEDLTLLGSQGVVDGEEGVQQAIASLIQPPR
jgi:hypothetical protein